MVYFPVHKSENTVFLVPKKYLFLQGHLHVGFVVFRTTPNSVPKLLKPLLVNEILLENQEEYIK